MIAPRTETRALADIAEADRRPIVLLWVYLDTHFRECIRVARLLQADGRYRPVVVFMYRYAVLDRDTECCRREGIAYEDHSDRSAPSDAPANPHVPSKWGRVLLAVRKFDYRGRMAAAAPDFSFFRRAAGTVRAQGARARRGLRRILRAAPWAREFVQHGRRRLRPVKRAARSVRRFGSLARRRSGRVLRAVPLLRTSVRRGRSFLQWIARTPEQVTKIAAAGWRLMRRARRSAIARLTGSRGFLAEFRYSLQKFLAIYRDSLQKIRFAEGVLARLRPVLMIFPEDNVGYNTGAIIKAGRQAGVPSVVIPYTIANAREPAEAYFNDPSFQGDVWFNRIVGRVFRRWRFHYRGRNLVRLPAPFILVRHLLGIAPPRPWILNSGYSDVIALESEAIRDYYVREGLPRNQLQVIGSLRQDELASHAAAAERSRAEVLRQAGLQDRERLIVCAWPPNQYPETRPGCEFRDYEELCNYWADTLASLPNCNVLIALHPRLRREEMGYIERKNARIVPEDVARLIPLCDVYVASVSATICMAIACGKPVVNYDVYRFNYDDFERVEAVRTMQTRGEFEGELLRITDEPGYYERLHGLQRAEMSRWGSLDGRCADRLFDLAERLVGPSRLLSDAPVPNSSSYQPAQRERVRIAS